MGSPFNGLTRRKFLLKMTPSNGCPPPALRVGTPVWCMLPGMFLSARTRRSVSRVAPGPGLLAGGTPGLPRLGRPDYGSVASGEPDERHMARALCAPALTDEPKGSSE